MRYEIHGFAGLGYPFTAGGIRALEKLIDDLPSKADAQTHPYWEADDIAKEIIFREQKFRDDPVVVFFTHSWGVKTGLEAAEMLGRHGIKVRYFAAIDPTALRRSDPPMTAPANIVQLDEFWSSRGGIFNFPLMARKRDPLGGKGGMVRNPHKVPHFLDRAVPAGHSATASHESVRKRILQQVKGIVR